MDPNRKMASSLGSNGTKLIDIGVVMTAGGADNADSFMATAGKKKNDNLLSIASRKGVRCEANEGYKILLEQAIYEMNRGSFSVAIQYLDRAVQVRKKSSINIYFFLKNKSYSFRYVDRIMI